jgi:hypothetical protein
MLYLGKDLLLLSISSCSCYNLNRVDQIYASQKIGISFPMLKNISVNYCSEFCKKVMVSQSKTPTSENVFNKKKAKKQAHLSYMQYSYNKI